jgi:hypothetical protein
MSTIRAWRSGSAQPLERGRAHGEDDWRAIAAELERLAFKLDRLSLPIGSGVDAYLSEKHSIAVSMRRIAARGRT